MAALDQLTGLMSVINGVKGTTTSSTQSGGTKTQQTNVSDQGVQQLINSILSGSGGVKNIGTRARSSGLYNSTSEDILLGNLYATAANQAELARSPTVTTSTPVTTTQTTKGAGVGDLAAGLGGAFLASQALNIGAKALGPTVSQGTDYISDLLTGLLGGSGDSSGKKGGIFDGIDFSGSSGNIGASSGGSTGISTGEGYGLNTSTLGNFSGSSGVSDAKGLNFGMDLDSGAGSVGIGGFGALGSLLGSVVGGLTSSSGGASGGGAGGSGGTSGGSVICTALKDKGLLDKQLHLAGAMYLARMNPTTVVGYQIWGRKIAAKIDKGHKGWTKFTLPFARSRTALLASSGTFADHVKNPLGTITKFLGEPVCFLIGSLVSEVTFDFIRSTMHNPKGV